MEEAKREVMSNKDSAGIERMKVSQLPKYVEEHGDESCEAI